MKKILIATLCGLLGACNGPQASSPAADFMEKLRVHCGKAYKGALVSSDAVDAAFGEQDLIMHVRECDSDEIRIPFQVGDDRSRTWVITRTSSGLRLKHDHRHEDGTEDLVTQYGGDSSTIISDANNIIRAEFPVDAYSISLFSENDLKASVVNIWAIEISENSFSYELSRPNRLFKVTFDSQNAVPPPPAPWGAN